MSYNREYHQRYNAKYREEHKMARSTVNQRKERAGFLARRAHYEVEPDETMPRTFDDATNEEIETIAVSIGASGARRPPSE